MSIVFITLLFSSAYLAIKKLFSNPSGWCIPIHELKPTPNTLLQYALSMAGELEKAKTTWKGEQSLCEAYSEMKAVKPQGCHGLKLLKVPLSLLLNCQKFPFTSSSFSNEISSFSDTSLKQQSKAKHSTPISHSVWCKWIENGIWSWKNSLGVLLPR